MIPIIDGHNDTLTRIRHAGPNERRAFLDRAEFGHLDLPRAREGGLAGGFFAVFTCTRGWEKRLEPLLDADGQRVPGGWSVPLPKRVDRRTSYHFTTSVISDLLRLIDASNGAMTLVRTATELQHAIDSGTFAVILHIEGAEAIDTRLESLDVLHAAGLRSLGPVWSRPNAFGHGVPFDFPRHPDTGPGLTSAGRRLVRRCNELRIMLDVSHLNARGFWDVAELSDAPIVATHSNAHALSASPRNLTDDQLDAVAASGGVVGLNYAVGFLRADGKPDAGTPLTRIADHGRYIADRIGVDHLALGSDFDGALIPAQMTDCSKLPLLVDALRAAGFTEDELHRIAHKNWVRVLRETWGE
ncbi:MAG: dipeptidase [Longimicrobiales bacterium]|nr:dipeptidase [Longimicrobiales bacterium]